MILGGIRFVVGGGGGGWGEVGLFLIRGVEVGGLKKAVKAFLCFSCNPELSCTDFDFFDLCCFCFLNFVGGRVVSSSPNLEKAEEEEIGKRLNLSPRRKPLDLRVSCEELLDGQPVGRGGRVPGSRHLGHRVLPVQQ